MRNVLGRAAFLGILCFPIFSVHFDIFVFVNMVVVEQINVLVEGRVFPLGSLGLKS